MKGVKSSNLAALELALSPQGHLYPITDPEGPELPGSLAENIRRAFAKGGGPGLLYLGGSLVEETLPPALGYWRDFGRIFFSKLCAHPEIPKNDDIVQLETLIQYSNEELERIAGSLPPMKGGEYLTIQVLNELRASLETAFAHEFAHFKGSLQEYLGKKHPVWNVVGRVSLHLAENKRNPKKPFAFMAAYASHLSREARVRYLPLARALEEYAGNNKALLKLLLPLQKAAEKSLFLKRLVYDNKIYRPLSLEAADAIAFLKDIPLFENCGVIVRVPDWWAAKHPPRPQVNVTVGQKAPSILGTDALLDFSLEISLDGETLSQKEIKEILKMSGGLVSFKGKWVELDSEKLKETLDHWEKMRDLTSKGLLTYSEAMRLLAGLSVAGHERNTVAESVREWSQVNAGEWLARILEELRHPEKGGSIDTENWLAAELRPYQKKGVEWLWLVNRLGIGGCLADDMGLGKTIQILGLLAGLKKKHGRGKPHLIVMPASLLANWKSEIGRFAPDLKVMVAHQSEMTPAQLAGLGESDLKKIDVALMAYGGLRLEWPKKIEWSVVVLDEAQAIKNPNALQTRAAKTLQCSTRLALTGTPIENRLSDLWSIFDFICPGLLGSARAFASYEKKAAGAESGNAYGAIRNLVSPYILRRLKTDTRIIADLPEKTELKAWCALTKKQAALYGQSVTALQKELGKLAQSQDGIKRRGTILAYLMRFKQICNHPSQWLGDGDYRADHSGKFARLAEICEPIADRQEKVLVFTQFREMTGSLDNFLAEAFGRKGLVLDGQTPVAKRKDLVKAFQCEQGPPYFILSLKAGGVGLNLTAANHVIHFDRWWNPAVENQATDRAFRIGQKKNVLVHKFICRGTVEEKIDSLIESKKKLAQNILESDASPMLTEMSDEDLIKIVSLDIHRALGEEP